MKSKTASVSSKVAIQSWLRPELTPVHANKDCEKFQRTIRDIDRLLIDSRLEDFAIEFALENLRQIAPQANGADIARYAQKAVRALRINILKAELGNLSYRRFSTAVATSDLLADFCRVREIDGIRNTSKSEIGRALNFFSEEQLRLLHLAFTEVAGNAGSCSQVGLEQPVDASVCLIDSTCLEANIHFPVDWMLLKDVAMSLLKAIVLIRRAGLFCRMPQSPEVFARDMNRLCIEITHSGRRQEGKKARKKVFRQMKRLLNTIVGHAKRHRDLFESRWEETDYFEGEKTRIVTRIDRMIEKVPKVVKQAHTRIVNERQVANDRKILSAYEEDLHVIVRGKAGKKVEFGNTLTICEGADGYILDWWVYRDAAPSESKQLAESLERQERLEMDKPILAVGTDRGFASKGTSELLEKKTIYDATCPRDPARLKQRMSEEQFSTLQRRRGSTEARIAILRQRYGGRLRQKGFANRSMAIAWSVMAHNLWLIARLLAQQDEEQRVAA